MELEARPGSGPEMLDDLARLLVQTMYSISSVYGFRKAKAEVLSQIQLLFLALNLYIRVIT